MVCHDFNNLPLLTNRDTFVGQSVAGSHTIRWCSLGSHLTYHGLSPFVPFRLSTFFKISSFLFLDHWHDVLVGSLLGTVISYFTYRQYYPSLASEQSHRPHSPRIEREESDTLPLHHRQPSSSGQDDLLQSEPLHTQPERYGDPFSPPRPSGSELHPDVHHG